MLKKTNKDAKIYSMVDALVNRLLPYDDDSEIFALSLEKFFIRSRSVPGISADSGSR